MNGGSSQALVCQSYFSTPTLTNILVTFRLPWNNDCRAYLGLNNVCFVPPVAETRTCASLGADTTFTRQVCTDQTYLKTRLVSENPKVFCSR